MSNEEQKDEMVDESTDIEEQDEEYSYTDEPKVSGGGSAGIWVIIILVIVALIAVGAYHWIGKAKAEQQAQMEQRAVVRQQQLALVAADLPEAQAALDSGDIDAMVEKLQQMDQKLQILASAANSAGDTEEAQRISNMREPVKNAVKALQPIYEQIQAKRDEIEALEAELSTTAASSLQAVQDQFGSADPMAAEEDVAPADVAAEEPASEEAAADDADAADGDEPAEDADADAVADEAAADDATAEEAAADDAAADEAPADEADPDTPADDGGAADAEPAGEAAAEATDLAPAA